MIVRIGIKTKEERIDQGDNKSCPLKESLENLPLFWKDRIEITDINPDLDKEKIGKKFKEIYEKKKHSI